MQGFVKTALMNTELCTLRKFKMSKPTLAIYGSKDIDSRAYQVFTHSHNLCLMQDGKILQYLELERYTRRKYDNRLDLFIEELFENKIFPLPKEFDFILANDFLSSSFVSKNGKIRFEAKCADKLEANLIPGTLTLLDGEFGVKKINAFCCPHELAHIFSALPFYGKLKENSLLLSFDGASSFGNYSSFLFRNGKLNLIENNWNDLGYASKFFNDNSFAFRMLGAERETHCSVPGKLMGFASWGNADEKIERWLEENNFFKDFWGRESKILESIEKEFGLKFSDFDTHEKFFQDAAASFQHLFETALLGKLEKLQQKFQCDYLYYGGGCALNIVANTKLLESGLFKDVFIAPCCSDSGLSIGAAAFLELQKGNRLELSSPYICNAGLQKMQVVLDDDEIKKTAELLLRNKIVGICNGSGECGPRALGNRSLIALANSRSLAQKLSMQVKKREWFRPVAPIMLWGNARKVSLETPRLLSKFMLMDFHIKDEFKNSLEGVVHADGTARIQTLEKEGDNPFMFRLLKFLYEKHGVLALVNTSFNAAGEPIVHTKEDARISARNMNIDALVLNGEIFLRGEF